MRSEHKESQARFGEVKMVNRRQLKQLMVAGVWPHAGAAVGEYVHRAVGPILRPDARIQLRRTAFCNDFVFTS